MYTTKNTKCSNFTCEIRTQCKRAKLSVYDSITPYFCFAYSKKKKYCKAFIEIDKIEKHNDLANEISKEFGIS